MAKVLSDQDYAALQVRNHKLAALENAGVDDWSGYYDSFREYAEELGFDSWDDLMSTILGIWK